MTTPKPQLTLPLEAYDLPRVSLTLTDETAWLTCFDNKGRPGATYPVAPDAVANAFRRERVCTGLLPDNTLWWLKNGPEEQLAVWLPPSRRTLALGVSHNLQHFSVPLPGFVFAGVGHNYFIWAAPERPVSPGYRLLNAPLPNVYPDGKVCAGTVKFPLCSADTIYQAVELFWTSEFNSDLGAGRVLNAANSATFLRSLRRAKEFPLERLLPSNDTIGDLMKLADRNPGWLDQPDEEPFELRDPIALHLQELGMDEGDNDDI